MSELVVRGLRKSFGPTEVLRGLDLTVPAGTLLAVLGPSGCGKTTLLRVVAGFETADSGEVIVGGRAVAGTGVAVPPERRHIGVVPQEGALFPHLTVAANVAFGLARAGDRSGRVQEMLDLVGLGGYGARMPNELSGGQQQRVALARALAPEPALVLLDEPFSALDTGQRAAIRDDVREVLHRAGATAVLVTHDQQEALSMADLVAVMRDGLVVQAATPAEIYSAPADLGVATFVGEAVLLDAVATDGVATSALGAVPVRSGAGDGPGTVLVRPEQLLLGDPRGGVPAQVTGSVFFGHDAMVQLVVRTGDDAVTVLARTQGPHGLRRGDEVTVRIEGEVAFFAAGN